jgi:hypothetical protein
MKMRAGLVRVEVDQLWAAIGVADRQARFLASLAQRGLPGMFAWIYMTAWLHPDAEALVEVQYGAARAGDDGGPGHVYRIRIAVEGVGQTIKLGQEPRLRSDLAVGQGVKADDQAPERLDTGCGAGS